MLHVGVGVGFTVNGSARDSLMAAWGLMAGREPDGCRDLGTAAGSFSIPHAEGGGISLSTDSLPLVARCEYFITWRQLTGRTTSGEPLVAYAMKVSRS